MPEPLGDPEFAALKEFVDSGDRIGYYGQLEEWGYKYGELARGVVTGDQLSGRTANNFFLDRAEDQLNAYNKENGFESGDEGYASPVIDRADMAELSQALMQADFDAREADDSPNLNGERLTVESVQRYHADVFREQFNDRIPNDGIDIEAWTPYEALQKRETVEAREELWDNMLNDPAIVTAARTLDFGDYGREQAGSGIGGFFGHEGNVGPYTIDTPNKDGKVIAGTGSIAGIGGDDGTARNPLLGTDGGDTITTYTGDDTVSAGGGNDRAYLGGGNDNAHLGIGDDIVAPGTGRDNVDGGLGIDFVDYNTGYDLPAQQLSLPNITPIDYLTPDVTQIYNFETEIGITNGETTMVITQPGFVIESNIPFTTVLTADLRPVDTAIDVEGYQGSHISDIVTLRGANEDLYLDGSKGEDTIYARLPEDVEAGAIFDNTSGIIPEGYDFENLPYDIRLSLENGQTIYIANFEDVDIGRIEEGIIVQANTSNETAPEISITNPDVLGAEIGPALENSTRQSVPLKDAVEMLSEDTTTLNDISNPSKWQTTVRDAVNHPDAAQMYRNLHTGGVETVSTDITANMDAEIRAPKLLIAGAEASNEAGIPLPSEQRGHEAQMYNDQSYNNSHDANENYDIMG